MGRKRGNEAPADETAESGHHTPASLPDATDLSPDSTSDPEGEPATPVSDDASTEPVVGPGDAPPSAPPTGGTRDAIRAASSEIAGNQTSDWLPSLLFVLPIFATWISLYLAIGDYQLLLRARPTEAAKSFLALWIEGFRGFGTGWSFGSVAGVNAGLIGFALVVSLLAHFRSRRREQARETTAAPAAGTLDSQSDQLASDVVALEARVSELVTRREGLLVDLDTVVRDLRLAAEELGSFADRAAEAARREADAEDLLSQKIEAMAERQGLLTDAVQGLATQLKEGHDGSAVLLVSATATLKTLADGQQKAVAAAEEIAKIVPTLASVERSFEKVQKKYAEHLRREADALSRSAERLESAAGALNRVSRPIAAATVALALVIVGAVAVAAARPGLGGDARVTQEAFASELSDMLADLEGARISLPTDRRVAGSDERLATSTQRLHGALSEAQRWIAGRADVPAVYRHAISDLRAVVTSLERVAGAAAEWAATEARSQPMPPQQLLNDAAYADSLLVQLRRSVAAGR